MFILRILRHLKITFIALIALLFFQNIYADSFRFNSYNNHGVTGLINMPNGRMFNESVHGITVYNGTPDQKITFTSSPYNWLEASFFYTNIKGVPYCDEPFDPVCKQDYKDKGFNFKAQLKEEGKLPSIVIGINDIAGTAYYSSEYIASSYGIENLDLHFGFAWGTLNGSDNPIKNPLGIISDSFYKRPNNTEGEGGQFQPSRYFSDKTISPFYGISYAYNENLLLKLEKDTTVTPGLVGYEDPKSDFSYGLEYNINNNFTFGIFKERGNYLSFKFIYKNDPKDSVKAYRYKAAEYHASDSKYDKLIKNLENNGIGVNKILETTDSIGLELTQFAHPNLGVIEEIVKSATYDAGISKNIKTDLRIANLQASSNFNNDIGPNANLIYERKKKSRFYSNNKIRFQPFIASREEFFKGAILLENDSELVITDSFLFSTNFKYSLWNNFDDLYLPPKYTYPAQVRSDVKDYLKEYNNGIIIGRAQFDYYITPKKNHHFMFTAGILEDMFSGVGFEYLYYKNTKNYAIGFEVFEAVKRDYEMRFGTINYSNVTSSLNFYYKNYNYIPFDMKVSLGEYLAGDEGGTIEISRTFRNGTKFGVFATITDVSSEQFGEGSFDKGIFFNVPVYGNFVNYTWRPLTKDPGAKLNRKNNLYNLLVKFKPFNK